MYLSLAMAEDDAKFQLPKITQKFESTMMIIREDIWTNRR